MVYRKLFSSSLPIQLSSGELEKFLDLFGGYTVINKAGKHGQNDMIVLIIDWRRIGWDGRARVK